MFFDLVVHCERGIGVAGLAGVELFAKLVPTRASLYGEGPLPRVPRFASILTPMG